ncbi:MAG TPA: dynamin family protein [Chthoniobacteraceae bacterium]|jgi:small GTP-binding protein|nr:dynamin family protein [Chthoniobacteraceae bacterium]
MIGDDYLQTRAQLGTALYALAALAHDLHASAEMLDTLQGLNASLKEPFLFVVMGEVKAGKSTVLNALFGREFCRADVLPATDRIYLFKYATEARDVPVNEHLTECYRPNSFLRDFNIVDTPGTNTIVAEHQKIAEEFVPMADLVLFVFSITNPWGASAWEFLDLIHRRWKKNIIFILQQSDLRNAEEIKAVRDHLEQTAREKLGSCPPIFPVSAKTAFQAKTGDPAQRAPLMAQSHFDDLEKHIGQTIDTGESTGGKLRSICQSALVIVRELAEKAKGAFATIQKDNDRIQQLGGVLEERKEQSLRQVGGVLWSLAQNFERTQRKSEELLAERLSWGSTFQLIFRKQKWHSEFQQSIDQQLRETLKRQIANSIELLETDLKAVWKQLHENIQKTFASEVPSPPAPPDFINERDQLLKRIELTLMERMSGQAIEEQMTRMFDDAAVWMRVPAGIAVLGGAAAAVAASLAQAMIFDITGTLAAAAAVSGLAVTVVKRARILAEFRKQMSDKREEILSPVEDHLRHAIGLFYQELGATFQPLQAFCAAQRKVYDPILTRLKQLDETFGRLASQLGA